MPKIIRVVHFHVSILLLKRGMFRYPHINSTITIYSINYYQYMSHITYQPYHLIYMSEVFKY